MAAWDFDMQEKIRSEREQRAQEESQRKESFTSDFDRMQREI